MAKEVRKDADGKWRDVATSEVVDTKEARDPGVTKHLDVGDIWQEKLPGGQVKRHKVKEKTLTADGFLVVVSEEVTA